ncbi:MAG: phage tail sheath family protein [Bacteroidales bacterium]|nr:phage tail sheath family protein [Bacteroidales bacterium]
MAYGGGTFTTQNKVLPGAYINFVSTATATATLGDRGVVAMPLDLTWGPDNKIFEVTSEDFQKNTLSIFGYSYTAEEMRGLRDLFLNCKTLYAYKLTSGGANASNTYATALYGGSRGNDIRISIEPDADDTSMYDVTTMLGTTVVDEQVVASAEDLVPNDFVTWNPGATLGETVIGMSLDGGTDEVISSDSYQKFMDAAEAYSFNICGFPTEDDAIKELAVTWTKRLREEVGIKFQSVLYDYPEADYMGIISVPNKVTDDVWGEASLVYWMSGLQAGTAVNKSCQNVKYNGNFDVYAAYTQKQLEEMLKSGQCVLHRVGDDIRVLDDINTLVTTTEECGEVFQNNQTIRVIDEIAIDVANIFVTKYLGFVPNDNAGRISLWSDIVKIHQELQDMRAIEDYSSEDTTVEQGNAKNSVVVTDVITVINAMSKLYMTVTVN